MMSKSEVAALQYSKTRNPSRLMVSPLALNRHGRLPNQYNVSERVWRLPARTSGLDKQSPARMETEGRKLVVRSLWDIEVNNQLNCFGWCHSRGKRDTPKQSELSYVQNQCVNVYRKLLVSSQFLPDFILNL